MKKTLFPLAVVAILFSSCKDEAKAPMSEEEIQTKVDSTIDTKLEMLNDKANEDLDRRMAIEVKPKADSIVAAKKVRSNFMLPDSTKPIILFDGVCNLCNGFVQKVIKHDRKQIFKFSSLQSGTGRQVSAFIEQSEGSVPDSIILFYQGIYYSKSTAVLKVVSLLGGMWKVLNVGWIFPLKFRDHIYDFVAKNRYRWFGKRDECMVPTAKLNARFLN